ncbi:MAG: hypothetical protein Ct9H300mP20_07090 [Gammaproteobacteria bacterium]|nr:MAG: hypothetical protein Ct9H300mP20_07090 [Gammaproteobacteria bacterium]
MGFYWGKKNEIFIEKFKFSFHSFFCGVVLQVTILPDYSNLAPENTEPGPTIGYNEDRNVYFGDLHVHTKHSFDAYIFGTTATPDDAYEYAKGSPIQHPLGYQMQLREPLDFYAVTDHGFF